MRALLIVAALLAAAAVGLYFWWRHAPDSLPAFAQRAVPRSPVSNPPLYRWRDAAGQLHITGEPPTDRPFEKVVVNPAVNVMPSQLPGETPPADIEPESR